MPSRCWKNAAVVAVLAVCGALVSCESCRSEPEARDREPLALIPDDALVVGSVEMRPLRESALYKRLMRQGNPFRPYLGDCEYDPMPDIERVWLGAGADVEQGRGSAVLMGSLDRDRVLGCFRDELRRRGTSLEEVQIEGFTAYSAGPGRPHLAWIDRGTVVLGDRGHVEKMLGLERGKGRSVRENENLLRLYERVALDRDVAFAALPNETTAKRLASFVPGEWRAATEARQVAVGARFEKGVDLLVTLRLASGVEAEKLAGSLKRGLERWGNNDVVVLAGLASHLKAIRIEQAGPEITGRATWSDRQLDSIARLALDSAEEVLREGPEKATRSLRDRLEGERVSGDAGPRPDAAPARDGAPSSDAAPPR